MADGALPGLQEALSVIELEATVESRGLSTVAFFFGLANIVISAWAMGAQPESFWMVYGAQAFGILGYRLVVDVRKTSPRTLLYFLDFCWIANFTLASLVFAVFVEVMLDLPSQLALASKYPNLGRLVCLIATGPLGWSVIALSNALVLHDIQHYSGCFIHLWPALTTLSVRWNPTKVMSRYPGHFDSLTGFHDPDAGADTLALMQLGLGAYLCWWVPFTTWMMAHGRHQSPQRTGWDTVYLNLVMTNGAVRRALGIRAKEKSGILDAASRPGPVLKYMLLHLGLCTAALWFSCLCYQHMWLHVVFCCVIAAVALFNASNRYHWMLTQRYSRALRKHIGKRFPRADPTPKED